uniref:Uncharacterized protein n=1 Tax=Gadus morhua TaxID=8049 RepID=A0A8C5CTV2_GADMO
MSLVPDLGGLPPSTAVRVRVITACFSRTNSRRSKCMKSDRKMGFISLIKLLEL